MRLIFIVGGAGQNKPELARRQFPGARVTPCFSDRVRQALRDGRDPIRMTEAFLKSARRGTEDEAVLAVVSDEVGCGIVPTDREERRFREANGRVNCLLAQEADEVYRTVAGVLQRIK